MDIKIFTLTFYSNPLAVSLSNSFFRALETSEEAIFRFKTFPFQNF